MRSGISVMTSTAGRVVFLGVILLAVWQGTASGEDVEWIDTMRAAQKALNESRYADAEQFLRAAVHEAEKFPSGDRRFDLSFNGLAKVLYSQGKYDEAERSYLQAVAVLEKKLGPGHLRVAESLNGLALIYQMQGRYKEAEPLFSRASRISEKVLGPEH